MLSFLRSSSIGKNLLILCSAHFVVDFFTGIWPIYKTICGMDLAQAGWIAGISGFFGESLQMIFGYFCDRGYRKQILLVGLLLGSSILWITMSQGVIFYFILLLFVNISSGAFHPAAVGYAGSLTTEHKAKCILCFASGGLLGLACSQMIFTKMLSIFGGHAITLFIPVFLVGIWMFFHHFPESSTSRNTSLGQMLANFKQAQKTLTFLYLIQLCSYSLVLALVFILPDVLITKTPHVWLQMGGGHFCYILGGALALPFMGYFCDRYGQKKLILCAISLSLCLFSLLVATPSLGALSGVLLLFFLGASLNSINPMIVSWGHKVAPHSPSTVSALLMGLAWCFSYLGPLVAGILYKNFAKSPEIKTLCCMGILLIFAFLFTWFAPSQEPVRQVKRA
ncbi:MAG: MFS transporter [Rhabdochlamydiaceae bacterium]|nr:MFS transporter [Rhabdochlamydiaceae bacterium]